MASKTREPSKGTGGDTVGLYRLSSPMVFSRFEGRRRDTLLFLESGLPMALARRLLLLEGIGLGHISSCCPRRQLRLCPLIQPCNDHHTASLEGYRKPDLNPFLLLSCCLPLRALLVRHPFETVQLAGRRLFSPMKTPRFHSSPHEFEIEIT